MDHYQNGHRYPQDNITISKRPYQYLVQGRKTSTDKTSTDKTSTDKTSTGQKVYRTKHLQGQKVYRTKRLRD